MATKAVSSTILPMINWGAVVVVDDSPGVASWRSIGGTSFFNPLGAIVVKPSIYSVIYR